MRIYPGTPRRHYEETLRSLGLVLDMEGYRHIVITEVDDAFVVTGLAYSTQVSHAAESIGRWSCVSGRFPDADVAAMLDLTISLMPDVLETISAKRRRVGPLGRAWMR